MSDEATIHAGARSALVSVGLNVADLDRSVAFYSEVFGFVERRRHELPGLTEAILDPPDGAGQAVGLVLASGERHPNPSLSSFGRLILRVDDVGATWERVLGCGGSPEREPMSPIEGITIAIVRDPDGAALELVQATEAAAAAVS